MRWAPGDVIECRDSQPVTVIAYERHGFTDGYWVLRPSGAQVWFPARQLPAPDDALRPLPWLDGRSA